MRFFHSVGYPLVRISICFHLGRDRRRLIRGFIKIDFYVVMRIF